MQHIVPKLSRTPGRIRHTGKKEIGADQEAVLGELQQRRNHE
jgi:hypothetical protein